MRMFGFDRKSGGVHEEREILTGDWLINPKSVKKTSRKLFLRNLSGLTGDKISNAQYSCNVKVGSHLSKGF